jgi:membrane-associated phospholipid phosphatase
LTDPYPAKVWLAVPARRAPTETLIMNLPHPRPPEAGWLRQTGIRVFTWWPAKMIGTTLGMTVFFIAYFWVLNHPLYPVTIMPLTAVDRLIGFWPGALPLYLSLWFYVSLAPALLIVRRELVSYGVAAVALSVLGLGIFLLWPTAVPRPEVDWSQHPAFAFLQAADAAGNACPSLHVAFAVFTAVWFARLLPQMGAGRIVRALNWLWCAGILYSTVAIRQHVFLDVLAGAALGAIVAGGHLRWLRVSS